MNDQKLYKWILLATITFIVHGLLMYIYLRQHEINEAHTARIGKISPSSETEELKMLFIQPQENYQTPSILIKKSRNENNNNKEPLTEKKESGNETTDQEPTEKIKFNQEKKLPNKNHGIKKDQPINQIQEKIEDKNTHTLKTKVINNNIVITPPNDIDKEVQLTEQELKDEALLSIDLPESQQKNSQEKDQNLEKLDKHHQIKKQAEDLNEELSRSINSIKQINQQRMEKERQFSERAYQKNQGIIVDSESNEKVDQDVNKNTESKDPESTQKQVIDTVKAQ